jgi:hypothetical protein
MVAIMRVRGSVVVLVLVLAGMVGTILHLSYMSGDTRVSRQHLLLGLWNLTMAPHTDIDAHHSNDVQGKFYVLVDEENMVVCLQQSST